MAGMTVHFPVLLATLLVAMPVLAQAPSPDSWIEDSKTGCRIRNPAPQPRESVTWSSFRSKQVGGSVVCHSPRREVAHG